MLQNGARVFLPLEGVVDLEQERARLADEVERMEGVLRSTEAKLANENFVTRAPEEVVQKERDRTLQLEEQGSKLREKLAALEAHA